MVCGMLAPGWPLEAARLAHTDAVISHSANGVYGEMYAVLTSLAYAYQEPRALILDALQYLPQKSEYASLAQGVIETLQSEADPARAWEILDRRFEQYNWIHAYPNMAADLLALWYSENDISRAFRWLAHAGLDVDCNAGLVGNVIGVMAGVPEKWSLPLNDILETICPAKNGFQFRSLPYGPLAWLCFHSLYSRSEGTVPELSLGAVPYSLNNDIIQN